MSITLSLLGRASRVSGNMKEISKDVFMTLLSAGLWEREIALSPYGEIDYSEVFELAEEQSVHGLISAGLEHVTDTKPFQKDILPFLGSVLQYEQQNIAMNEFVAKMVKALRKERNNVLLIKGQGIAQCYERPLWRASGDVDLLVDSHQYETVKSILGRLTSTPTKEKTSTLEYVATIDNWIVELHGTLHCRLTNCLDSFLDKIQDNCCNRGGVREWNNRGTSVYLPSVENDIFVIFTHILKHFFREGVGLRQLCDWCRLLWTFHKEIDSLMLEKRLKEAGIISEWKAFAALAVDWLGMPVEAMLLYSDANCWKRKAKRIMAFVLETGNFGHNKDLSYLKKNSLVVRKIISFLRHTWDLMRQFLIFPLDSIRVWRSMVKIGLSGNDRRKKAYVRIRGSNRDIDTK